LNLIAALATAALLGVVPQGASAQVANARRDSLSRAGIAAANAGEYERALDAFRQAVAIDSNAIATYNVAAMNSRLKRTDETFAWLDRAITRGFRGLGTLQNDEDFAAVRGDTRYAAAVARLTDALTPCARDENARKFDFWVGEWDVRTVAGGPAGHSVIERVSGQCALLENWSSARGTTGKSLNAYNAATGQWQQYWIGQVGGVTEYRESTWNGPSLSFLARPRAGVLMRLTFTPVAADHVRQHGEISNDDGKTWTTQYDLQYWRKAKSEEEGER
jgi:hypothetical protein